MPINLIIIKMPIGFVLPSRTFGNKKVRGGSPKYSNQQTLIILMSKMSDLVLAEKWLLQRWS